MRKIICFISLAFLLLSCKKQEAAPEFYYDYFPIEKGRYVVYDVCEITHDEALAQHDTVYYQLKTLIGDTVTDNSGRETREFFRYTRPNASAAWQVQDLWTVYKDNHRLESIEENQRIIRLVFAVTKEKEWNPNAYNTMDPMEFYYSDLHTEKTVGNTLFQETVTVEEQDFFSLVDYRRKYEVYARKVGLIQRYYKDLRIENFDTLAAQKGTEQFYTVVSYGIE